MSKLFVPDLTKSVTHACRSQCDTLPRREWVSLKVGQSSCGVAARVREADFWGSGSERSIETAALTKNSRRLLPGSINECLSAPS
jgi:hypothetical protein